MTKMDTTSRNTGICLNMIVKNETKVLDRLFRSVQAYIDYFVVVDTGSTDGTQAFIRNWMEEAGIEGEVHDREWVNFGHNRQQALELAVAAGRGDWLLFIDADEELGVTNPQFWETLQRGVTYSIEKHHAETRYAVPHLLDITENRWQWAGPVHNYLLHLEGPYLSQLIKDPWIIYHAGEGAKSHGVTTRQKYLRDAKLLSQELRSNPDDSRSQFYLGQSFRDAGEYKKALAAYQRRAEMEGFLEEKFQAQLQVGIISIHLNKHESTVTQALLDAFEIRPTRAEPLHRLAQYFREKEKYGKAYAFARAGLDIPRPDDALFVVDGVYEWQLLDELGIAAYWVNRMEESRECCLEILRRVDNGLVLSEADLKRIHVNLTFAEDKMLEQGLPLS